MPTKKPFKTSGRAYLKRSEEPVTVPERDPEMRRMFPEGRQVPSVTKAGEHLAAIHAEGEKAMGNAAAMPAPNPTGKSGKPFTFGD